MAVRLTLRDMAVPCPRASSTIHNSSTSAHVAEMAINEFEKSVTQLARSHKSKVLGRSTNMMGPHRLALWALVLARAASDALVVTTSCTDGSYSLSLGGIPWLTSGTTLVRHAGREWSSANRTLNLLNCTSHTGTDPTWGSYNATAWSWAAADQASAIFQTEIRSYSDRPDVVTFHQTLPLGLSNASTGQHECDWKGQPWIGCDWTGAVSAFPAFSLPESPSNLAFAQFYGEHLNDAHNEAHRGPRIGSWAKGSSIPDGLLSGPMAVFDATGRAIAMGPFDGAMDAAVATRAGTEVSMGLMGGVNDVPVGYSMSFLIVAGPGLNRAFDSWGSALLDAYGNPRKREPMMGKFGERSWGSYVDTHLGYETDNGAYYYYSTLPGLDEGDTLVAVGRVLNKTGVPVRWVNLDSWRYFKGPGSTGGEGVPMAGGCKNWSTVPSMISGGDAGLAAFASETGWDIMAHNRWWQNVTDYASQNGGTYPFIIEQDSAAFPGNAFALPTSQDFWSDLFDQGLAWGLSQYEQDWLWTQFLGMEATTRSVGVAGAWLDQMGAEAATRNITIQYCMSLPRHAVQSARLPAVTQIRVSDDYGAGHRDHQWRIGRSSILARSLGLGCYKDGFLSSGKNESHGKAITGIEPWPALQAAVASYSRGPVVINDGADFIDAELLLRSCNSRGELLRPGIAMTALDRSIVYEAFPPANAPPPRAWPSRDEIWSSWTSIDDATWLHVLIADVPDSGSIPGLSPTEIIASLPPTPAGQVDASPWLVYSLPTATLDAGKIDLQILPNASSQFSVPKTSLPEFELLHATPATGSVVLLGELAKWTPVSRNRIVSIDTQEMGSAPSGLAVTVRGEPGESVTLYFASVEGVSWESALDVGDVQGDVQVVPVKCKVGPNGTVSISAPNGSCSS